MSDIREFCVMELLNDPKEKCEKLGHKYLRFYVEGQKCDHDGTRTHNLLIRSQTPYPLGHAAIIPVKSNSHVKILIS